MFAPSLHLPWWHLKVQVTIFSHLDFLKCLLSGVLTSTVHCSLVLFPHCKKKDLLKALSWIMTPHLMLKLPGPTWLLLHCSWNQIQSPELGFRVLVDLAPDKLNLYRFYHSLYPMFLLHQSTC